MQFNYEISCFDQFSFVSFINSAVSILSPRADVQALVPPMHTGYILRNEVCYFRKTRCPLKWPPILC